MIKAGYIILSRDEDLATINQVVTRLARLGFTITQIGEITGMIAGTFDSKDETNILGYIHSLESKFVFAEDDLVSKLL